MTSGVDQGHAVVRVSSTRAMPRSLTQDHWLTTVSINKPEGPWLVYLFPRVIRLLSCPPGSPEGWERIWLLASVRRGQQVGRGTESKVKRGFVQSALKT